MAERERYNCLVKEANKRAGRAGRASDDSRGEAPNLFPN